MCGCCFRIGHRSFGQIRDKPRLRFVSNRFSVCKISAWQIRIPFFVKFKLKIFYIRNVWGAQKFKGMAVQRLKGMTVILNIEINSYIFAERHIKFPIVAEQSRCVCIVLSTHRAAYVARRVPFEGSKLVMPLINPIVPIEIISSLSSFEFEYFFAICATSRRLCSISTSRAAISPFLYRSI